MRLKLQFVLLLVIAIAKATDAGVNSAINTIVLGASDDPNSSSTTPDSSDPSNVKPPDPFDPSDTNATTTSDPSVTNATAISESSDTNATTTSDPSVTNATDTSDPSVTNATTTSDPSVTNATDTSDPSVTNATTTSDPSVTNATDTSDPSVTNATTTSDPSVTNATTTSDPSVTNATTTSDPSVTNATDTSDPPVTNATTTSDPSVTNATVTTQSSSTTTITTEPTKGADDYPIQVGDAGKPPCILIKMNITLKVTYEMKNSTIASVSLPIPDKVDVTGSCGNDTSTMILSWSVPSTFETQDMQYFYNVYAEDKKNEVSFYFKKDDARFSLDKIEMEIILDEKTFPDAKDMTLSTQTDDKLNLFAASATNSKYVCSGETSVPAKSEGNQEIVLSITDVSLIAFNDKNDVTSRSEENCLKGESVETSNVGAIVGGIIGALVIVGIIGFVIWRRKRNSYAHSEVP